MVRRSVVSEMREITAAVPSSHSLRRELVTET